jgi:ABC-type phosphate transport system permease subunit
MRDVFEVTPPMLKESAYGLGATTWEVVSKVVLPYTKTGVVGGIMLGLGRALGETMAVTFVIGNFNQLDSLSLFEAANSITSALANEFAEAGRRPAPGLADLPGAGAVLHHLRGAVAVQAAAVAAAQVGRDPHMSATRRCTSRPAWPCTAPQAVNVIALALSLAPWPSACSGWSGSCSRPCAWVGGLAWPVFTEMTPPPQAETGGLANAIFGSLMMVSLATLLGTPIGVLAGIYLAEYGQKTWLGSACASSTTSCCRRRPS